MYIHLQYSPEYCKQRQEFLQVAGWSELADGSQYATFWDGNALIDLNSLLDPVLAGY